MNTTENIVWFFSLMIILTVVCLYCFPEHVSQAYAVKMVLGLHMLGKFLLAWLPVSLR